MAQGVDAQGADAWRSWRSALYELELDLLAVVNDLLANEQERVRRQGYLRAALEIARCQLGPQ